MLRLITNRISSFFGRDHKELRPFAIPTEKKDQWNKMINDKEKTTLNWKNPTQIHSPKSEMKKKKKKNPHKKNE